MSSNNVLVILDDHMRILIVQSGQTGALSVVNVWELSPHSTREHNLYYDKLYVSSREQHRALTSYILFLGMIYVMQSYFNFTVRNPCLSLTTHHEHCSCVHGPQNDGEQYTVRDLQPFNITTHQIRLSSLAFSAIDMNITYSRERDLICLHLTPKGSKYGHIECRTSWNTWEILIFDWPHRTALLVTLNLALPILWRGS